MSGAVSAREGFDKYAREVKELIIIKSIKRTEATSNWWARMPEELRCYMLYSVADDGWERWQGVGWQALPDGLRMALALHAKAVKRRLDDCPWV